MEEMMLGKNSEGWKIKIKRTMDSWRKIFQSWSWFFNDGMNKVKILKNEKNIWVPGNAKRRKRLRIWRQKLGKEQEVHEEVALCYNIINLKLLIKNRKANNTRKYCCKN